MCEAQHVKALSMERYKFNLQQHETECCQDWIWKAWGFPDFQSLFWLAGNLCSSFPGCTFDQGFITPVKCDVDELESTSSFRRADKSASQICKHHCVLQYHNGKNTCLSISNKCCGHGDQWHQDAIPMDRAVHHSICDYEDLKQNCH